MSVFYLLGYYFNEKYTSKAWFTIFGIALLIAGWLADTHIGQYKVVCSSIWIMWIATVLATVSSVIAFSRHNSLQINGHNTTILCLFETSKGALNTSFNYKWITIPDFLSTVSITMLYIGAIEFISAQVPFFILHHMGNRNSQLWILVSIAANNC